MENIDNFVRLGDLGVLFQGTRHYIKNNISESSNTKKVKILKWADLKKSIDEQDINELSYVDIDKKYYKDDIHIKKGDIVFAIFPTVDGLNIKYIAKNLEEKCLYGETMYVFRTKNEIDSEYIFCLLNSGWYNKSIEKYNVGYKLKLKHNMILNIKIPILDKDIQKKIVEENQKITKLEQSTKVMKDELNKYVIQFIEESNNNVINSI